MNPKGPSIILVVKDASIVAQIIQFFPQDHYEVLLARNSAETIALCETRLPKLVIVPLAVVEETDLMGVLTEIRSEKTALLGVATSASQLQRWRQKPGLFDKLVVLETEADLSKAVRGLLEERRRHPRVMLEFPVELGDDGEGLVREFSAASLRVETSLELQAGAVVEVRIGWGDEPVRFQALVGRIDRGVFLGQTSVVLHVRDDEVEARRYLDKLARRVVELQHILGGEEEGPSKFHGPLAWELTRRAEEAVRDSKGLVVRESGEIVVRPSDEGLVLDFDTLEGRYEVQDRMGQWGVGEVFRATHRLLGRPVVLKVLRSDLSDDPKARQRLEMEARCAVMWAGKNIVDILDFGGEEDELYYTMEDLSGETLREALDKGRSFAPLEVVTMGLHLASGLVKIHLKGGGHYDLCPENIYLHRPGGTMVRPLLLGIAGPECWGDPKETYAIGAAYRPPDAGDGPPRPGHDVYALATILREVLAGGKKSEDQTQEKHSPGERRLFEVLSLATASQKSDRFRDAAAFADALDECYALLAMEAPQGQARLFEPPPGTGRISVHPTPMPGEVDAPTLERQIEPPAEVEVTEATANQQGLPIPPPPPPQPHTQGVPPPPPPPPPEAIDLASRDATLPGQKEIGHGPQSTSPDDSGYEQLALRDSSKPTQPSPRPVIAAREQVGETPRPVTPPPTAAPAPLPVPSPRPATPPPTAVPAPRPVPSPRPATPPPEALSPRPSDDGPRPPSPRTPAPTGRPAPTALVSSEDESTLEAIVLTRTLAERSAHPSDASPPTKGDEDGAEESAPPRGRPDGIVESRNDKMGPPSPGPGEGNSIENNTLSPPLALGGDPSPTPAVPFADQGEPQVSSPRSQRSKRSLLILLAVTILVPVALGVIAVSFLSNGGGSGGTVEARVAPETHRPGSNAEEAEGARVPGTSEATAETSTGRDDAPGRAAPSGEADGGNRSDDAERSPLERNRGTTAQPNSLEHLSPSERRRELLGKARRRIRRGLYREAEAYLEEARRIAPGADIVAVRAASLEKQGRYRAALRAMKQAVGLSPSSARYHDRLGSIYLKLGRRAQACAAFQKAGALAPRSRTIARHIRSHCGDR